MAQKDCAEREQWNEFQVKATKVGAGVACATDAPRALPCICVPLPGCGLTTYLGAWDENVACCPQTAVNLYVLSHQIFKAPKDMDDIQVIYSPKLESLCGYQHRSNNKSEEFMVAGTMVDGKVYINSCSFVVPWTDLTLGQKRGFLQVYAKHCHCKVRPTGQLCCHLRPDRCACC
ncbi:hypothetical protein GDO81_027733 [Engystomops pustulosus]|uniref:Metalloproteinase inhibitor 1 n=1 Tax=Engystomops pustulosus TaxID=76066 RepID=A0AAV6YFH7_ENGPU|nr:hypothetical protein GDO81_027733 [Engystomops pustulosus]